MIGQKGEPDEDPHCTMTLGDRGNWTGGSILHVLCKGDAELSPDNESGACSPLIAQRGVGCPWLLSPHEDPHIRIQTAGLLMAGSQVQEQ